MEIRADDEGPGAYNLFLAAFAIIYVALTLLLFFDSTQVIAAQRSDELGFFKVVDDRSIYDRRRDEFSILKFNDARGHYERYIATHPSHAIPFENIKSITITKQKVYGPANTSDEMARDGLGLKSKNQAVKETYPYGYVYKALFQLDEKVAKLFQNFANANDGNSFDLRLGKHRLSVVQFVGRFDGNEFAGFLESRNLDDLKLTFLPVKAKTKWE